MTGLTSAVVGVDAFASSVAAAGAQLVNLQPVNDAAGVLVLDAADIPYKTGRLAGTVHAIADDQGVDLVAGGPAAPYAAVVHARDPFLVRALTDREDAVLDLHADHVAGVLDTIQGA